MHHYRSQLLNYRQIVHAQLSSHGADHNCAGLIVWRIRKINHASAPHVTRKTGSDRGLERTRLERVIRIIIESGMLYTLFVILTFACELAGSNAIYGVSDMVRLFSCLSLERY